MKGLYPIIRRVRRPLLPVEEPRAPQPVVEPEAQQPDACTHADATPPPAEQIEEVSSLPLAESTSTAADPSPVVTSAAELVAQPVIQGTKPKRTSNGRKAKSESA